jgi:hypothetical protein
MEILCCFIFAPLFCLGPIVSIMQRGERVKVYKEFMERKTKAERIVASMA